MLIGVYLNNRFDIFDADGEVVAVIVAHIIWPITYPILAVKIAAKNNAEKARLKVKVKNNGFSIIEFMVFIAIIGIFASVAVPNFEKFRERARRHSDNYYPTKTDDCKGRKND